VVPPVLLVPASGMGGRGEAAVLTQVTDPCASKQLYC
jgi:hypothetical protein